MGKEGWEGKRSEEKERGETRWRYRGKQRGQEGSRE